MILPLLAAAVAQYRDDPRATAGRGDRHGPRPGGGAGGIPGRKPLLAARLPRLPRGTGTAVALHRTVERLMDRRPAPGQLRLLPLVVHVGARLDPRAGRARRGGEIWRRDRRVGWVLVPVAVLYLLFLGLQGRYFGRWLLPIFPIACLLAASFALEAPAGRRGASHGCVPAVSRRVPANTVPPSSPPWP